MSVFQSRAWQSAWWEAWGQTKGFRLVRPWDGEVSGLYESRYRYKGVLPIRSLQFVGTSHRELRTPRTEYNSFFRDGGAGESLASRISELLETHSWTEAVFSDLLKGSEELEALVSLAARHNWGVRINSVDDGYAINTSDGFQSYLDGLGSNTRLRLFNRRKLLESEGDVEHTNLWQSDPELFFEHLNQFHLKRWGKPCFGGTSLAFHLKFLDRVEGEGGIPYLSALSVDGNVVSVLYNVWYRGTVYNIQAGFMQDFHRKLALGSLHLGYAIEDAFNCRETKAFDLLAGCGKNEDYKKRFSTDCYQFLSVMLVKSAPFRALYWMKG